MHTESTWEPLSRRSIVTTAGPLINEHTLSMVGEGGRQVQTYHILMWVHEYIEPVIFCFAQYVDGVLYPKFIVTARSPSFNRLPCEYVANGIITVALQSRKVNVRVFFPKGSAMKFDIVAVEKVFLNMRWNIWGAGEFRVSGHIYAAQQDMPARVVPEFAIFNGQTERRHDRRDVNMCSAQMVLVPLRSAPWIMHLSFAPKEQ